MVKKKQRISNILTQILQFKEILFTISTIIVVVLNLWLASHLAPYTQRVANLEHKVLANERSIKDIKNDIVHIRTRVDKIYEILTR